MNFRTMGDFYLQKLIPAIMLVALLTSCTDQYIVNKIKLIQTISYDTNRNGVKSAVIIGDYKKKGETELQLLETESNSNFDIIPRLDTKINEPIVYGQLGMVLFGKDYAKNGIWNVIHTLCHDAKISTRLQVGVAEGDASELLRIIQKSQVPFFLSDMIEQNIKNGNLPMMNLHTTLFNFYGEGRDVFLPHLAIEQGEIKIDGLALFRSDKYIANINNRDALLLKMLLDRSKNGSYMVPLKKGNQTDEDFILIHRIDSNVHYIVNRLEPIPAVTIRLNLKTEVKHYPSWFHLTTKVQMQQLEKTMGDYFEDEIQKLLSFCKKNKVDPVGLGDLIRSRSKEWNEQNFQKVYPSLETKVSVKLSIVPTGVGQ